MSTAVPRLTLRPYLLVDACLGPKENPELNFEKLGTRIREFCNKSSFLLFSLGTHIFSKFSIFDSSYG